AAPSDCEVLRRWDEAPHVVEADPNDDWDWEHELVRTPQWREWLIAEVDGRHRLHADHRSRPRGVTLLGPLPESPCARSTSGSAKKRTSVGRSARGRLSSRSNAASPRPRSRP